MWNTKLINKMKNLDLKKDLEKIAEYDEINIEFWLQEDLYYYMQINGNGYRYDKLSDIIIDSKELDKLFANITYID